MGIRTKPRVYLTGSTPLHDDTPKRPQPINDVETDEAAVLLRLDNLARTGDLGYDDSREWGELFPTVPTLIGALHLLPELLEGRGPEERRRLADYFAAELDDAFQEKPDNLFARVLEPNRGMSTAYELLLETRRLKTESEALRQRNAELVKERGIAYRATAEWNERFEESRKLDAERAPLVLKLDYNPDLGPTAKKMRSALRDFERAGAGLREGVLAYIQGDAGASYDRTRSVAEDWLVSFERLKAAVRAPNPKAKQDAAAPAESEERDTYYDE